MIGISCRAMIKGGIGDTACVQRHIVNDHAIDHNGSHDNGKEDTFR